MHNKIWESRFKTPLEVNIKFTFKESNISIRLVCFTLIHRLSFFNPFPPIDASAADESLKNIVTKGEIAQNEQFLLLTQCFQLFSVIYL